MLHIYSLLYKFSIKSPLFTWCKFFLASKRRKHNESKVCSIYMALTCRHLVPSALSAHYYVTHLMNSSNYLTLLIVFLCFKKEMYLMLSDNHQNKKRLVSLKFCLPGNSCCWIKGKLKKYFFSSKFWSRMPPRPLNLALNLSLKKIFDLLYLSTWQNVLPLWSPVFCFKCACQCVLWR